MEPSDTGDFTGIDPINEGCLAAPNLGSNAIQPFVS